jgi:tRNA ligase
VREFWMRFFLPISEFISIQWASLEKYTAAPCHLTLKSNGCIIFIAALGPEKLIVTSKHSLGQLSEGQTSHAMMGEQWLLRHLASKGKTKEDLAVRLHADNITAVAEVSPSYDRS